MGKGSGRRPTFVPQAEYEANYERIFGKKEKVRWRPPPLSDPPVKRDEGKETSTDE